MRGTSLELKIIKTISDLLLFTEIAQHTWEKIYDSGAQNSFGNNILFFPGHLDMQPVTHVKKIKFLPNLSKRDGGCL